MLEILYKSNWLIIVALPLWRAGQVAESSAGGMTIVFALVLSPIIATSWKYFFMNYILVFKKK